MKTPFFILVIVLIVLYSCNTSNSDQGIKGFYTGTFQRGDIISNVTLHLSERNFIGESDSVKFPAICNGNFSISKDIIKFENLCPWTAEFDWTLILSNEWYFRTDDNNLTLTNSLGDIYILKK